MQRNRTWSFISPVWRSKYNRTLNTNGYIPALNNIIWYPADFLITQPLIDGRNNPTLNPVIIVDTLQPVKLKWRLELPGAIPKGFSLYYRKNGGNWVIFPRDLFTADTFNDGDSFQLATVSGGSTGMFSLKLINDVDNLFCSQALTIVVTL